MPNLDLGTLKTTVVVDTGNATAAINDINNAQSTMGDNAKRVGDQIDASQRQMVSGWADVRGQLELTKDLYEKISKPVIDLLKSCTALADTNGELAAAQEDLNEQLDTLKASLGEVLAPLIESVLDTLTGLVGYINEMPQGVKAISTAVLVAVGAFGILAPTIQKVTAAIKALEAGTTVGRVMLIASAIASATAALAVMLKQADNTADKFTETKNHFNDLIKDVEKDKAKTVNIDIVAEMKDNVKTQLSLAVNDVNTILSEIETEKYTDVQLSVDGWKDNIDPQSYVDKLDDILVDTKATLTKYSNGEYVSQDELDAAKAALNNAISYLEVTSVDVSTDAGQELYDSLRGKYLAAIDLYGAFQQPIAVVTDDENLAAEKQKINDIFDVVYSEVTKDFTLNANGSFVDLANQLAELFGDGDGSIVKQTLNLQQSLNNLASSTSIATINELFDNVSSSVNTWETAVTSLKDALTEAIDEQTRLSQQITLNAAAQVYGNYQYGLITEEEARRQLAIYQGKYTEAYTSGESNKSALTQLNNGEIDMFQFMSMVYGASGAAMPLTTESGAQAEATFYNLLAQGRVDEALAYLPQTLDKVDETLNNIEELGASEYLDTYTEWANTPLTTRHIAGAGDFSYYDRIPIRELIDPFINDIEAYLATRPTDANGNPIDRQTISTMLAVNEAAYATATDEQKAELSQVISTLSQLEKSLEQYDYWQGILDIYNGVETELTQAVAAVMAEQGLTFDSSNPAQFFAGAASQYLDSLATIETGASQSGDVYNDEVHNGDNITNNVTINNNYSHGVQPMNANREAQQIIDAINGAN